MNTSVSLLLVEDSEDDAFLMERAIKAAGVENRLQIVRDGEEAVDFLEARGKYAERQTDGCPGLVFLDLKLPRLSGFDVLKWIRETVETRRMVVVVLTSSNRPADITLAYDLGANSYVVKPPAFDKLVEFARAIKSYWLRHNAFPDGDNLPGVADGDAAADGLAGPSANPGPAL